ncbi:hypothetical protein SLS53_005288 [Cytospora paraplurivora]|uniref:Uncharacterized protein n=1 Tax=Cytospora paraplurivora TaxID=2898453 RepID=A0AAN9U7C7_9PEZI
MVIRGGKVLVKRGEYEQGLRDSLKEIQTKSTKLMEEAIKSNIHQLNHCMSFGPLAALKLWSRRRAEANPWVFLVDSQETQKLMWHMAEEQQEARVEMKGGFNSLKYLLDEYLRRKDAVIEQKERELEAERRENVYLAVENQRLRSASPMLYSPWTPQLPIQTAIVGQYVDQEALRRILNTRDLDQIDMAFILDKKADIPAKLQVQAEQLINTPLFCDWIVSASSAKLLVQWDGRHPKTIAEVSPLSIFCTTMVRALQENERFISVQWFCGRHIDPAEAWPYMGGHAMIASLIDQLLRQRTFDTRWLHREINLADLEAGDLVGRTRLLGWLVRQLPQTVTLFFIVDGVVLYERDEYWDEAGPVLAFLLSLTADTSLQAAVKVLFTSAPGPGAVREPFALDELVLDVDTLPRITWAPSEERLARELGYSLG